ncbi:MAG: ABC transporter substrate-binding protein, partial [Deltaproteobacteria bacterium]|nr:ABC transporter substrate-binding protein [Deltaproteobacteria bacterium]
MRRIACLLIPDLPLQAALRAEPELLGSPLVLSSGPGPRAELVSISQPARVRGCQPGQSLVQARAVCPDLVTRIASPVLEQAAREALLDVALSLAPRAELAERAAGLFSAEGAVYVDASGIQALHSDESAFASRLHAQAERAGLRGVVSLASSRGSARLVARHLAHSVAHPTGGGSGGPATCILSREDELAFLAPLSVDLLDPDDRTAQALTRFGLHSIRDLLRLSRRDLAARLGPELLGLVARARGEQDEPPLPEPREQRLEEGLDLDHPIERLEPLAFVLRGLVSRLAGRLELRSLGCAELRLSLQLEGGRQEDRRIGMTSATRDERVWLRLIRLAVILGALVGLLAFLGVACDGGSGDGDEPTATPATSADGDDGAEATPDLSGFPVTLERSDGEELTLEAPPERMVVLSPGHVEILFAVGAGDGVIAVDENADYPPEAAAIEVKLSGYEPSVEAVANLDPDFVIVSSDPGGFVEALDNLGIPVFFDDIDTEITTIEGVSESIEELGRATGRTDEAEELVAGLQDRLDAVLEAVADVEEGPSVYHELDETLYSVSPDSFPGDMYNKLKARNIAGSDQGPFPPLNQEAIIDANPEVIIL